MLAPDPPLSASPPPPPLPLTPQVGGKTLVSWFGHYGALLAYSLAYTLLRPFRPLVPGYTFQRLLDALEYGSGSDYRCVRQRSTVPPPHCSRRPLYGIP